MNPHIAPVPSTSSSRQPTASSPLRMLVHGIEPDERTRFKAILDVLSAKLPQPWSLVDEGEADLYLHTRDARAPVVGCRITGLLLREDDPPPPADALWLPVPPRVMAMLDLLHLVHDRLVDGASLVGPDPDPAQTPHGLPPVVNDDDDAPKAQASVAVVHADTPVGTDASRPTPVGAAPSACDEKMLAASLARLFAGPAEHCVRVRILGFGTLYACPKADAYFIDFDAERLDAALESRRFILTAISPGSVELAAVEASRHALDELLWRIGLLTPREGGEAPDPRHRLRSWPDFGRLPHSPVHLPACAALSTTPMTADELMVATGMDALEADRFLHACELCGLLETVDTSTATMPAAPATAARGNLFDRLWRRLVK